MVLTGEPNAGKSSLLNALTQKDAAIVTDIPGTTRDVLREKININGIPVHVIDTAGIRESDNIIEIEGIKRAQKEIEQADIVLHIIDNTKNNSNLNVDQQKTLVVYNKIDLSKSNNIDDNAVYISAKTGEGLDKLTEKILEKIGVKNIEGDQISARERHLTILKAALVSLKQGLYILETLNAGELLAEHLKDAHRTLNEITGEFTADDLLGEIFSKFCIGK